jgi:alpha,alpha-trehalase
LEEAHLTDWKLAPKLLGSIRDKRMRLFATEMHKIWPQLARRFVEDVHQAQEHYPLLPVPNPFIIPGNLVQMYYYFDTYWIFKGLLLSELFDTAKGMLRNFGHLMKGRGHIPNSGFIKSVPNIQILPIAINIIMHNVPCL